MTVDNECKHYDREEINQSVNIKRIKCKECKKYKCIECDNFFDDKPIPFSNLWLNFCSSKCMFDSMKKEEEMASITLQKESKENE